MSDCIFCKIANGEIPTDLLYEDANVVAFRDLNPQAPTHVLVVPKAHYANIVEPRSQILAFNAVGVFFARAHDRGQYYLIGNGKRLYKIIL